MLCKLLGLILSALLKRVVITSSLDLSSSHHWDADFFLMFPPLPMRHDPPFCWGCQNTWFWFRLDWTKPIMKEHLDCSFAWRHNEEEPVNFVEDRNILMQYVDWTDNWSTAHDLHSIPRKMGYLHNHKEDLQGCWRAINIKQISRGVAWVVDRWDLPSILFSSMCCSALRNWWISHPAKVTIKSMAMDPKTWNWGSTGLLMRLSATPSFPNAAPASLLACCNNFTNSPGSLTKRIPQPPPPAVALIITGKLISLATMIAPYVESKIPSLPGTVGTPAFFIVSRGVALSPITRIVV